MKQVITMNRLKKLSSLRKSGELSGQPRCDSHSVGATLTEILMALMVMGVGLVSVASLFPITMKRSIQAVNLTNAVMLKYQVEEYMQAFEGRSRNEYDTSFPTLNNTLGNVEFTPRSVAWGRHPAADLAVLRANLPLNVVSVIDPIGASFNTATNAKSYGKDPHGLHSVSSLYYTVDRKNGGFNFASTFQKNLALSMFASNDGWKPFLSSIEVTRNSASEVTLGDADASDMAEFDASRSSGSLARIVLVDINGKQSHVSPVTSITDNDITFGSPLPVNGLYGAISEVRLELFEPRYTCLITLRKQLISLGTPEGPGLPAQPGTNGIDDDNSDGDDDKFTDDDEIGPNGGLNEVGWPGTDDVVRILGGDLVVFFRRDFSPLAEQVYGVENLNKGQVGTQPQEVRIRWNGSIPDAKPRIRQGAYVFDSRNGFWYQIRTVIEQEQEVPAARLSATSWIDSSNDREAIIILDRSPEANGQFLMVPENIVEVFEFTAF